MPDLFDNLFDKISVKLNGKTHERYRMSSSVNAGRFYQFHNTGTNNKYWMPKKDVTNKETLPDLKTDNNRKGSVASTNSSDEDIDILNIRRGSSVSSKSV